MGCMVRLKNKVKKRLKEEVAMPEKIIKRDSNKVKNVITRIRRGEIV